MIKRNLKKVDGSDLDIDDVTSIVVDIIQKGIVVETYAYPATYLYQGDTAHQIVLEVNTTISGSLVQGEVMARWTITAGNAAFQGEGIQKDIIDEKILFIK